MKQYYEDIYSSKRTFGESLRDLARWTVILTMGLVILYFLGANAKSTKMTVHAACDTNNKVFCVSFGRVKSMATHYHQSAAERNMRYTGGGER